MKNVYRKKTTFLITFNDGTEEILQRIGRFRYGEVPEEYAIELSKDISAVDELSRVLGEYSSSTIFRNRKYFWSTDWGCKIYEDEISSVVVLYEFLLAEDESITNLQQQMPYDEYLTLLFDKGLSLKALLTDMEEM